MIVVFPFANLGPSDDAYFAAGMADEIASRLASVKSLGVISRTSTVQYDRSAKTMEQIGEDLGVSYVLDGTVRWERPSAGVSRVRVTPQLIDVARDVQLWSAIYEDQLDEIFRVQSQIAEQVTRELDLTLNDSERRSLESRPTENMEAYQAYLRGIENTKREYYSEENRRLTVSMFERAVELDPAFALAWAALSLEHSYLYHLRYDVTDERQASARRAAERALELQPDLPEAHLAMGHYYYRCHRDYDHALEEFSIASRELPNDSRLLGAIGAIRRRQGDFEEAVRNAERAIELSPRDAMLMWDTGVTYTHMRKYEEARRYFDRSIALDPYEPPAYALKAINEWTLKGDLTAAREALEAMPDSGDPFSTWIWFNQEVLEGNYQAALERISSSPIEMFEWMVALIPREQLLGDVYSLMGDRERARAAYESARTVLERERAERPDDARVHSALGLVLAGLGLKDEAIAAGRRAVELYPISVDAFQGPDFIHDLAAIYARTGELDAAMDLLEDLLATGVGRVTIPIATGGGRVTIPMLRLDPTWIPLRDHPRFQKLVASEP